MTAYALPAVGGISVALLMIVACTSSTPAPAESTPPPAPPVVAVTVPSQAGPVNGTTQNSDEFIWRQFVAFVAPAAPPQPTPVVFETWASDKDTFSTTPRWPTAGAAKTLQASVLGGMRTALTPEIDVPCNPPGNAAVGGFPTAGPPTPCIAEEVRRNRPQFDYIVGNNLNTQAGLKAAFAKGFKVTMPTTSISVKGDWVPVITLQQWIPQVGDLANIRRLYYTTMSGGVEYALVSLHVSSRENPDWVWGTFEHQMNPGRCDSIGCFDTFGAQIPVVLPNQQAINTQYGACAKTDALKALMTTGNLSPVWENYCLKSTQVTYSAPNGTPSALGNSVIEGITGNGTIAASSCIACHAYASFGSAGTPLKSATNMLPFNPTGPPIPAALDGSLQFDFMWGVLLAP